MCCACTIGTLFHVKYRSRDGMVDEDALLQFADISTQGAKNQDKILLLSSPLDDITRHAWRVSQIRQFRITDLGISIEFCHNCYRTHIPQYRSFNLFVHTSVMNTCVEFICKNTQATACSEMFGSFVTIYRIQNHHCPVLNPPSTPPPPVPPANNDNRPPIPSRDYPRFGYLNGPCAKPRLRHPNLVSPYRITNKIVINDDGSVSQESTILGHRGNTLSPNPLKPPRKQDHTKTDNTKDLSKQKIIHRNLHRHRSGRLLPPKDIKRTSAPLKNIIKPAPTRHMGDNDNDNDDEVYQESWMAAEDYVHMYPGLLQAPLSPAVVDNEEDWESWIAEGYVHMHPDLFQPPAVDNLKASHDNSKGAVQTVNQVPEAPTSDSHSPSVDTSDDDDELDFIDREYINIQNILIELDVKSVQTSQGSVKPPIKKRTFKLIKTENETQDSVTRNKPHVKPRKISLNLPASPKPIPRRRTITTSQVSPLQKEFDFSEQGKQVDLNITHDGNLNDEVAELTSQLDIEARSTASPKLPIAENCNIGFSEDSDDVFTENATTPHSHFPLG